MALVSLLLHLCFSAILAAESEPAKCPAKEKYVSGDNTDIVDAKRFAEEFNARALVVANKIGIATWNYESNLTEANKNQMLKVQEEEAEFSKEGWKNITSFAWKTFEKSDSALYRWFKHSAVLGTAVLPNDELTELHNTTAVMSDTYGKAKICSFHKHPRDTCNLTLEPDMTNILRNSRNYEELQHVWVKWRDATGKKMKDQFLRYVELSNEAACLNGFADAGEFWRANFESDTFQSDVEDLWHTLKPLYQQLHAYARRRLIQKYPHKGLKADGPIPAHLLGNMWAQSWTNILDIVKPYPNKPSVDVTDTMIAKKMTPLDMFKLSEKFFTSLGLIKMTPEFWNRSIIEKPTDREMVCHASAWDFYDGEDFRIKMCTSVNMEDLITVHHEMGHIEYYLQYRNQPQVFRGGANEGFHEAVGDTLALSVSTPGHLHKIGLLDSAPDDYEADINNLMRKALEKIAFIPFGYLLDAYRWKVFDGKISKDELNSKWWEYRLKYQGLCPPVRRTEEDFDPAAKYHVIADVPYIRYFVSFVIQFQFHKGLCEAAGYKGTLHKCDIYQNEDAGKLLSDTLSLGSSVPWTEAMKIITNGRTSKMDAAPMMEYFEPLLKWLKEQNKDEYIGWISHDPMMCPSQHITIE